MIIKKVLIIVPVAYKIMPECLKALEEQDYFNYEILVDVKNPVKICENKAANGLLNDMNHRNELREKALKTDAEYFLMVDDDTILPQTALTNLMLQMREKKTTIDFPLPNGKIIPKGTKNPEKFIIGGWYPFKHTNNHLWVCGNWVEDDVFCTLNRPQLGLIKLDMIGFGCCLVKREVLEKIILTEEMVSRFSKNRFGQDMFAGVCVGFCNMADELGYNIYIDGSVICDHLVREEVVV